ncbi:MAG: hypothetical protein AAB551_02140 [Patescibacteria group bacterium]
MVNILYLEGSRGDNDLAELVRVSMTEVIERRGHAVTPVSTHAEAVSALEESRTGTSFDLALISNVRSPLSGVETVLAAQDEGVPQIVLLVSFGVHSALHGDPRLSSVRLLGDLARPPFVTRTIHEVLGLPEHPLDDRRFHEDLPFAETILP